MPFPVYFQPCLSSLNSLRPIRLNSVRDSEKREAIDCQLRLKSGVETVRQRTG